MAKTGAYHGNPVSAPRMGRCNRFLFPMVSSSSLFSLLNEFIPTPDVPPLPTPPTSGHHRFHHTIRRTTQTKLKQLDDLHAMLDNVASERDAALNDLRRAGEGGGDGGVGRDRAAVVAAEDEADRLRQECDDLRERVSCKCGKC